MLIPPLMADLPEVIPLPHSSGPPAMPAPAEGCAVCRHLDKARRAVDPGKDPAKALRFGEAYMSHWLTRHTA
ncbi:hypothetical protein I5Q34_09385 [Streptomyces sp. AV19]|uniref:hypothetical protein n=1 Tax=Streptomyces sp. AV19 TaxID=2793068 RepID=UPI0018FEA97C|nr:hypothetical protein [Streptomyces sp. AV19]MBH1934496.1 hypothetical protein [Streptomyces sp. AV19]MDG4533290.1 hypothetical protein [Streptomyces sp. AV19]